MNYLNNRSEKDHSTTALQLPEHDNQPQGVVVASCSVADLFAGSPITASDESIIEGRLRIPEYQRPYRWGQKQIKPLLADLREHFAPNKGAQPVHDFYLGSIILHRQKANGSLNLNIIDGQQRLTTMGLLAWRIKPSSEPDLRYSSLKSQNQIRANIKLLLDLQEPCLQKFNLTDVNVTVVVTDSEDDAYRFFETENTENVRLNGSELIKAYHLRAVPDRQQQDKYARIWESLEDLNNPDKREDLNPLVDAVLKVRSWKAVGFRDLPSRRHGKEVRERVVLDLAISVAKATCDTAFQQVRLTRDDLGRIALSGQLNGYAMQQPLNAGINTINYLRYFHSLRRPLRELQDKEISPDAPFENFYRGLICNVDGCAYLKKLYDSCLLLYASHLGQEQLFAAALWLFYVVYALRVKNKAVRESSVQKFVRDEQGCPIFDLVLMSYTHEQCIEQLKLFKYNVNENRFDSNDKNGNSVRMRFIRSVNDWFSLGEINSAADYQKSLKDAINETINQKKTEENYGQSSRNPNSDAQEGIG